jgi:SAM-dependent methyltransferase
MDNIRKIEQIASNKDIDLDRTKQLYIDNVAKEQEFDDLYGVNTKSPIRVLPKTGSIVMGGEDNSLLYEDSNGFQSSPEDYLDKALVKIKEIIELDGKNISEFNFIDIGCGAGKPIFYLLSKNAGFKSYSGFEIDSKYFDICESNKEIMPNIDKSIVNFYNKNALNHSFDFEKSVVFFSNPFIGETRSTFIKNNIPLIEDSDAYLVTIAIDKDILKSYDLKNIYSFDWLNIWRRK